MTTVLDDSPLPIAIPGPGSGGPRCVTPAPIATRTSNTRGEAGQDVPEALAELACYDREHPRRRCDRETAAAGAPATCRTAVR